VIADGTKRLLQDFAILEIALDPKRLWVCGPKGFEFDLEFIKMQGLTFNMRLLTLNPQFVYSANRIVDDPHFKYQKALDLYISRTV
jgi:hypothetical protein